MKRTLLAIAAAAATFASAIGLVTTGAWLISEAALRPPLLTLEVAIVSVRAFGISRGSFRWVERVVSHDSALHETVERRTQLWVALAKAGPRGAWGLRTGDAITRVMQDAELLQDRITRVIVPAAAAIVTAIGAMLLQLHLQSLAALCFFAAFIVAGIIVPALAHRIEFAAARRALDERALMNSRLSAFVQHRDEMRVLGIIDASLLEVAAADARRVTIETRAALLSGLTQWAAMLASGLAVVGGLLAAIPAVLNGSLQGPHLAVVALLPWSASEVITALALAATALVRVRSAQARLEGIEQMEAPIPAVERHGNAGLFLRNLTVRWRDSDVVHAICLDVPRGQRVALVGRSGAGKSSVISAVLGLVEYQGSVIVGGEEDGSRRASLITAVPQAPHIFHTTTRENLRLAAGPVEDEQLRRVLDRVGLAHLDLDRDLAVMPLSGGEAQRLGLARALLLEAPVIVLDEPTEHLDEETAAGVMATIHDEIWGRALLMTTHRLTDLRDFDRIYIIDGGSIMCSGTFVECLMGSEWFRESVEWRLDKARVD